MWSVLCIIFMQTINIFSCGKITSDSLKEMHVTTYKDNVKGYKLILNKLVLHHGFKDVRVKN